MCIRDSVRPLAALVAGAAGRYDDLAGERPDERTAKGLRGHAAALRRGQVTGGVVKAAAVGSAAAVAGWLLADADADSAATRPAGAFLDIAVRAGVVAGTANLVNLLDLRPGRALKAVLVAGAPLVLGRGSGGGLVAGPAGVALALLPGDLAERRMLGDAGANALGAVLGVGWAAGGGRASPGRRIVALVVLAAVTAASEVVSFSRVIDATPVLRGLDRIGRRPDLGTEACASPALTRPPARRRGSDWPTPPSPAAWSPTQRGWSASAGRWCSPAPSGRPASATPT